MNLKLKQHQLTPLKILSWFFVAIFAISFSSSYAQENILYPRILKTPYLEPDSIAKKMYWKNIMDSVMLAEIPFDSLPDTIGNYLMMNEMELMEGPFSTAPIGCSWYCATEPAAIFGSSFLQPNGENFYDAFNVHDFDLRTAWVEGKENYGIDEAVEIEFEFKADLKLTHVTIYNGYCKSIQAWNDNSRARKIGLYANNEYVATLQLRDIYKGQSFYLGKINPDENGKLVLKFVLLEVYAGDKFSDTAISEINFDGIGDH